MVDKKEYFYRLTTAEYTRAFRELTAAQRGVLFYLRTRSPFAGAKFDVSRKDICDELGIHKSTVSKAIAKLIETGWISAEATSWTIKLNPHADRVSLEQPEFPTGNQVSYRQPEFPTGNDQPPEPKQGKDSDSLRSIDYKDIRSPESKKNRVQNDAARTRDWLEQERNRLGDRSPDAPIKAMELLPPHIKEGVLKLMESDPS